MNLYLILQLKYVLLKILKYKQKSIENSAAVTDIVNLFHKTDDWKDFASQSLFTLYNHIFCKGDHDSEGKKLARSDWDKKIN